MLFNCLKNTKNMFVNYFKEIKNVYGYKITLKLSIFISFIAIFFNTIDFFSKLKELNYLWLFILGIIYLIIKSLNKKILKMFILKSVNALDIILNSLILSEIVIILYLFTTACIDKKLYISLFVTIGIIIVRIILTNNKTIERKKTIFDLQELCINKVNIEKNSIGLLEEKDVDYDLLDRQSIINQLYNTIINCYPAKTFTIGLDGKWGSGKTTIINNVLKLIKKNKIDNYFVVVKFDPWEYNDEKAMLKGLIEQILINTDLNAGIENLDLLVNSIINVIFSDSKKYILPIINSEIKNVQSKIKFENIINNYLIKHDKRMILIIDNLDRIDSDKIKFMLKIISTTLNLKNTITILLYDDLIIQKELDKCFGTTDSKVKYMEKIVQLKIDIPQIDINRIEDLKNKIANNLMYDNSQIIQKKLIGDNIVFNDIRELKRFINNILSALITDPVSLINNNSDNINKVKFLNKTDLINLEFIKSKNPSLYYDIWENKTFYISDDRKYDIDLFEFDYTKINKLAKEHFENLFLIDENKKYQKTLLLLFPNIKKYLEGRDIFNSQYNDKEQYKKGIVEHRIYNTRYFDLYFTKSSNDFIRINSDVYTLIRIINNSKSETKILTKLKKNTEKYTCDELKVFMEVLEMNVEKIEKNNYFITINSLYEFIDSLPTIPYFFEMDAKRRAIIIIANLLNVVSNDEIDIFCNEIIKDKTKISDIHQILYWMQNDQNKNDIYINKLNNAYQSCCQNIIDNNIDLYSDENYSYNNIWGLYHYDKDKTINYIKNIICDRHIYRLLNDLISRSIGSGGYGYSISKENIDALVPNIDLDKLIKKHGDNLSKDEEFIKKVYNHYKFKTDNFNREINTVELQLMDKI